MHNKNTYESRNNDNKEHFLLISEKKQIKKQDSFIRMYKKNGSKWYFYISELQPGTYEKKIFQKNAVKNSHLNYASLWTEYINVHHIVYMRKTLRGHYLRRREVLHGVSPEQQWYI